MLSFSLVIGVAAAVWVYRDSGGFNHGREARLLWTLGTAVFFPVFLPLYFILGRRGMKPTARGEAVIDVEAVVVGAAVPCPMCARQVNEDFKICPYCGFTLKPVCGNCGQTLQRDWKICPSCRTAVEKK